MFDGLEIDMLSLGDADCIIVTAWSEYGPFRVLIDGGNATDFPTIKDFLLSHNMKVFWAVVCTHPHADHADGLIRLVKDPCFTFYNAWMHDIGNHVAADSLRRASTGNSSQADGVRQVCETTKELASAFASRGLVPLEPFGAKIADWPFMTVLSPSVPFYKTMIEKFAGVELLPPSPHPALLSALEVLRRPSAGLAALPIALPTLSRPPAIPIAPLAGLLANPSVDEKPITQPFNDTSIILGVIFKGSRLIFTADAGSKALDRVHSDWKAVQWMQVPHHGSDGNLSRANIERFCPQVAFISARGSTNHPSRAIVNGLIKTGATVCSTHSLNPGNLHYWIGRVPDRKNYGPAVILKKTPSRIAPPPPWPGSLPSSGLR
jgi:beta-lactamase superfamily II metal-dependent hydrolase